MHFTLYFKENTRRAYSGVIISHPSTKYYGWREKLGRGVLPLYTLRLAEPKGDALPE